MARGTAVAGPGRWSGEFPRCGSDGEDWCDDFQNRCAGIRRSGAETGRWSSEFQDRSCEMAPLPFPSKKKNRAVRFFLNFFLTGVQKSVWSVA